MQFTRSKIIALVIALGYLVTAIVMWGWDTGGLAIICVCLSLPLAFIWFPEVIHEVFGREGTRFTTETPAPVVTLVGWLFLVGYAPLLAYLLGHW